MTRDRLSPFGLTSRERRRHPPFAAPLQGAMSETVPIPQGDALIVTHLSTKFFAREGTVIWVLGND